MCAHIFFQNTKFTTKTADGDINIDPQLLFQRLVIAGTHAGKSSDVMRYELCAYMPTLFESRHALVVANKPAFATAIWDLSPPNTSMPNGDVQYVHVVAPCSKGYRNNWEKCTMQSWIAT